MGGAVQKVLVPAAFSAGASAVLLLLAGKSPGTLQGCLTYTKTQPPRTQPYAYA